MLSYSRNESRTGYPHQEDMFHLMTLVVWESVSPQVFKVQVIDPNHSFNVSQISKHTPYSLNSVRIEFELVGI